MYLVQMELDPPRSAADESCVLGTLDVLSKISLALVQRVLLRVSLYDCCCFGAACRQTRDAVVAVAGIPVTQRTIEAYPGSLVTPSFRRFLSVMLEFHLPMACPHHTVLHHYLEGLHTFACRACGGALKFTPKIDWRSVLRAAFSTGLDDRGLRRCCFQCTNGPVKPVVLPVTPDATCGHLSNLILKPDLKSLCDPQVQKSVVGDQLVPSEQIIRCACDVCKWNEEDISGDDMVAGVPRTGRRKGRRAKGGSRIVRQGLVCQHCSASSD